MSGKVEEIKGRVKEAAGAITNNDELRTEGQAEQTKGKASVLASSSSKESPAPTHGHDGAGFLIR